MHLLTEKQLLWARRLLLAFIIVITLAATVSLLVAGDVVKHGIAGAVACALILGSLLAIATHGDRSPRGELADLVGKAFVFAGAAPGILLVVGSLAPAHIPEMNTADWASRDQSAASTAYVDARIDQRIQYAFRQARGVTTEQLQANGAAVGFGVVLMFLLFFIAIWSVWRISRHAQNTFTQRRDQRRPPAPVTPAARAEVDAHQGRAVKALLAMFGVMLSVIFAVAITRHGCDVLNPSIRRP